MRNSDFNRFLLPIAVTDRQRHCRGLSVGAGRLILPERFEPIWRKIGVPYSVRDILVAQIVLQRAGVVTFIGELVTAGMTKHVRVDRERELRGQPRAGHELADIARRHRSAPFRDEQIGAVDQLRRSRCADAQKAKEATPESHAQ
jgi:hypothetical protein